MKKESYLNPNQTYDIVLKIGSEDLTSDLIAFKIITSIDLPYQSFELSFYLDPNDIITKKIYGQTPIKVTINLLAEDNFPTESTEFELMYLESDMQLTTTIIDPVTSGKQKDRMAITIKAVARQPYITMNTYVNSIYKASTLQAAIEDLIKQSGATLKYDTNKMNEEVIDQILVPPTTLYNNLKYLNETFGLFNGLTSVHCSYDNTVYVKNLTNKMLQAQTFTIYQLSLDGDNTTIIKKCNDGKHYYTIRDIKSKYEGNTVFALLAPEIIYVVKPRDRLDQKISINLEDFTKKYGLISKNDEIFFDKTAIKTDTRKTVKKDHTGYELTESFINSNMSKGICNITDMTTVIERNIKILNLMNVGESVEFTSSSTNTSEVSGRFILRASEIKFNRLKDWETSAILALIRTNRSLT